MNRFLLALPVIAFSMFAFPPTAGAAELSIAPPPISSPSFTEQSTRVDLTYIGFDTLDGDGFGFSMNHKRPLSERSGFNVVAAAYGFEFNDGDTTASIVTAGGNYEHQFVDDSQFSVIGFGGPVVGYLYFETCTAFCVEDDSTIYGLQGGAQLNIGAVGGLQFAPFVVIQSLSGSNIDTISTTSLGLDITFGDFSLSGALNQSEDDDVTVISLGVHF